MIKKYALIIITIFSLIFIKDISAQAKVDEPAPVFQLTDSNGKEHSLSDFAGKFVVLEWVNFDCPFVKKHYTSGNMQSLQKKYTKQGVIWLSICSSAEGKQGHFSNEEINKKMEERKSEATAYLIDADGKVGKMYGAKTTPHMFVINPEGKLIYAGAIDNRPTTDTEDVKNAINYVSSALDSGMNNEEVKEKSTKPYGCSVKY